MYFPANVSRNDIGESGGVIILTSINVIVERDFFFLKIVYYYYYYYFPVINGADLSAADQQRNVYKYMSFYLTDEFIDTGEKNNFFFLKYFISNRWLNSIFNFFTITTLVHYYLDSLLCDNWLMSNTDVFYTTPLIPSTYIRGVLEKLR